MWAREERGTCGSLELKEATRLERVGSQMEGDGREFDKLQTGTLSSHMRWTHSNSAVHVAVLSCPHLDLGCVWLWGLFPGDIQTLPGCGPGPPAPDIPGGAGAGPRGPREPCQPQLFWGSV